MSFRFIKFINDELSHVSEAEINLYDNDIEEEDVIDTLLDVDFGSNAKINEEKTKIAVVFELKNWKILKNRSTINQMFNNFNL